MLVIKKKSPCLFSLHAPPLAAVARQRCSGAVEREDGGRQASGRGEEHRVGAITVDHAVLAPRTRQRVVSGSG